MHHRVDAKGVADEHHDGDQQRRETKSGTDGKKVTSPVGVGGQCCATEREEERAGGEHQLPVRVLQDEGGQGSRGHPDCSDDDRGKERGDGETRVCKDGRHEHHQGCDACVLAEEEKTTRDAERTEERS